MLAFCRAHLQFDVGDTRASFRPHTFWTNVGGLVKYRVGPLSIGPRSATEAALLVKAMTKSGKYPAPALFEPYRSIVQNKAGSFWVLWATPQNYKGISAVTARKWSCKKDKKGNKIPVTALEWAPRKKGADAAAAEVDALPALPARV